MKHSWWLILIAGIGVALLSNNIGLTGAFTVDLETSTGNNLQAWSSTIWTQSSQSDFEAGVLNQVDTDSTPGEVVLAEAATQGTVAEDDFESGGWSGGTGWLWEWWHEGGASITTSGSPHSGSYHLELSATGDYIDRATNLSGKSNARLQFWAEADSLGEADYIECKVYNGTDWFPLQTWHDGDDDNTYHYYDIDLSAYPVSSEYYVTFSPSLSGAGAAFYIDELEIIATWVQSQIASDDFESGGWSGGLGWLWDWWHEGDASIVSAGTPRSGTYHLRLRSGDGYVDRAVDLTGKSDVRLQFWAKAYSFEEGEIAECLVYDGVAWDTVHTWVDGDDDDDVYHFFNIDLSPYIMSSQFYVAFTAGMSGTGDYFYVDDLALVEPPTYYSSGTLASQVLDAGTSGARWDGLFWDNTSPVGTGITFEVRAGDAPFAIDTPPGTLPWTAAGDTSPVTTGLPEGRYMQWRATLTTSDTSATAVLEEVRVYHN